MSKSTEKTNPHQHHRERLRNRYLENGISSFQEHEILEMMLFYSIPVINTNPIAHELLSEFGSLKNVLETPPEALAKVKGMGEKSAFFLSFMNDVYSVISKNSNDDRNVMDFDTAGEYLVGEFRGEKTEKVIILLLDSKNKLISKELINEGSFDVSNIDTRKIVWLTMAKNAAKVIIAHNHTNGNPNPSLQDKATTASLTTLLDNISVKLEEHYVIADDKYVGIKNLWK